MLDKLIGRITFLQKEMGLEKVKIKPSNEDAYYTEKSGIITSMKMCNIEYSEWILDESVVLITNNYLNHAGISAKSKPTFSEFITLPFDLENQAKLLEALYRVYNGDIDVSEVHVAGYSHVDKTMGFLKISFIRQKSDLNKPYISFVTQSIRHLSDSVKILTDKNNLSVQILQNINTPIAYCSAENGLELCNDEISSLLRVNSFEIINMTQDQFMAYTCERLGNAELVLIENDDGSLSYQLNGYIEDEEVIYKIDLKEIKDANNNYIGNLIIFSDQTYYNNRISRMKKLIEVNELLSSLDNLLTKEVDIDEIYNYAMQGLKFIIAGADRVSILLKAEDDFLRIRSGTGYSQAYINSCSIPYDESIAGRSTKNNTRTTVYVEDVEDEYCQCFFSDLATQEPTNTASSIISPFMLGGNIIGFLSVESERKNAFDSTDVNIVEFARNRLEQVIERYEEISLYINASIKDELTGVYNRRYFTSRCEELLLDSEKHRDLTLVVFDLDNLKMVNDHYGHHVGDQYIVHFARSLEDSSRKDDVFARIGGDEFAGLYINATESSLNMKMTELQAFFKDNPIVIDDNKIWVSFSYGMSTVKKDSVDLSQAMKVADEKMYEHKKSKKGLARGK